MKKNLSIILLFSFFTQISAFERFNTVSVGSDKAKYISYREYIMRPGTQFRYDQVMERLVLYYRGHMSVILINHNVILVDGSVLRSDFPVIRKKGDILIPYDVAKQLSDCLYGAGVANRDGPTDENTKDGRTEIARDTKNDEIKFIIIDPGHGGKDPGAVSGKKIYEKNIVLDVSRLVAERLKKGLKGIKVVLTRNTDVFIELDRRTEIANSRLNRNENGIFVSIHANASLSPKIAGYETYYLSQNPSNDDARNTAALENNVVVLEKKQGALKYGDIDYIEARMMTTQIQKESRLLAESIQTGMRKRLVPSRSLGVKKADFFVLRGALMPSALVEIGFLTNRSESRKLLQKSYQNQIARGISEGIMGFIDKYNSKILQK